MAAQIGQVPNAVLRDKDWIRRTFMLASDHVDQSTLQWRLQTLASQKFTDTRLGGNWSINTLPQYTRHADVRVSGSAADNDATRSVETTIGRIGMGRFYSEQIDDNNQYIHLRFGVPEYNGMLSFFTSFFDGDASTLANEGRAGIAYYVGRAIGMVVSLGVYMAFPLLAATAFAVRFLFDKPATSYYYMRPAMALYWNRVNLIANAIAVNMGLVPRVFYSDNGATPGATEQSKGSGVDGEGQGEQPADTAAYNDYAHKAAPDIFREGGGVDVYKVANRAQRLANHRRQSVLKTLEGSSSATGYFDHLKSLIFNQKWTPPAGEGIDKYLERYHSTAYGNLDNKRKNLAASATTDISQLNAEQPAPKEGEAAPTAAETSAAASKENDMQKTSRAKWKPGATDEERNIDYGYDKDGDEGKDGIFDFWKANRSEGSDFISWRIDHQGTISESFSNSTRDSDIASKINGMSSSARSARFSFSEGETGIGPLDAVKSMVGGLVSGMLDSIHLSGLLSLAGSAFVHIPKQWDGSSVNMPSASYTIQLRTPYGNKLSRFTNLYVPLACLLAAALPLSSGPQAYTSPFLCQLYYRGRNQIKLGMITSLSVSRGEGNLGWNKDNECLGIDVSFEVTDLSQIMAAPIDSGWSILKPWKGLLPEDNAFYDYMAVLGNLSLADQIYTFRRLALNLTRLREQADTYWTKGHIASMADEIWLTRQFGHLYGAFVRGSERTIAN